MPAALTLPRRVLMTGDAVGGVWTYALDLARGFGVRGIETTLAVLGPEPGATAREEAAAIPGLQLVPTRLPLDWTAEAPEALHAAARAIAELAARVRADTVHLHTPALVSDTPWPAPVVAVAHSCVVTWWRAVRGGGLPPDLAWRARCMALGLARAAAVVVPSRSFAEALREAYGMPRAVTVVRNGSRPMPHLAGPRRRAVLTAGRLWDEGKGLAVLDVAARGLEAPVYAAGPLEGPHGVTARFAHLLTLGSLEPARLAAQYASIPVYAAPARYEPFGLAVLEAAQAGMALVLSDIPSFRELWGGAARLVSPDDPAAWQAALRAVLDDAVLCARLAARASLRAREYSLSAMVRGTLAVHRAVLATPALAG